MPLQTVDVRGHQGKGTRTIALWDTGATLNLITPELATELRLRRKPVKLDVSGVGGITQEAGEACSLQMVDRKGRPWTLTAVVMKNISESVSGFPIKRAAKLFGRRPDPSIPAGPGNLPSAFHVYSMRQAIEEGFILDVLHNYTSYKRRLIYTSYYYRQL